MISDYINDGYTETAYIKAVDRIHYAHRITFRPMLMEERAKLFEGAGKLKSDEYERKSAAEICRHIVWWDLTAPPSSSAPDGSTPLPIKAISLLRLKPALLQRISAIVCGLDGGDADPESDPEARQEQAEQLYESALNGETIGQHREASDEKN